MQTVTVTLDEKEYERVLELGKELRSTVAETATGLVLYGLSEHFANLGGHGKGVGEFKADVLMWVVAQFDKEKYAPEPEKCQLTLDKTMVDAAIDYAEGRGEKIASYLARLVEQDMEQAPVLNGVGKEAAP